MSQTPPISGQNIVERFEQAMAYFRRRGHVVFVNEGYHFWERHGFVQQSLAKLLTEAGVRVTWFDYFGWRKYEPVFWWNSPLLQVRSIFRWPGDRFKIIHEWNDSNAARIIERELKAYSNAPVLWVQGSLSESIAQKLPNIDIFSFFDDPYRHAVGDPLLKKARLVTCQNQFAFERIQSGCEGKSLLLFPPYALSKVRAVTESAELPAGFPKKVAGYFGSFLEDGTDFQILENILRTAPDWGVMMVGRTDEKGLRHVERLKRYKNLLCFDWVPPNELERFWNTIDVTVLPYRQAKINDGAFPVKILDSLGRGIPVVATAVHKTSSLNQGISRILFADQFVQGMEEALSANSEQTSHAFEYYEREMDPRVHLVRVSEFLQNH